MRLMAIPGEKDGVFSEYCTHAASMTFKLPDNVSTMEGGLMEPLAVVMHACELSNAKLGETAVVLGAGCIGLVTLMEKAKELGAARVFNSRNENIEEFVNLYPFHKDEVIKAVIKM